MNGKLEWHFIAPLDSDSSARIFTNTKHEPGLRIEPLIEFFALPEHAFVNGGQKIISQPLDNFSNIVGTSEKRDADFAWREFHDSIWCGRVFIEHSANRAWIDKMHLIHLFVKGSVWMTHQDNVAVGLSGELLKPWAGCIGK